MEIGIVIFVFVFVISLFWKKLVKTEREFFHEKNEYAKLIEEQRKKAEFWVNEYAKKDEQVSHYTQEIDQLKTQLIGIKKELEFFKNIEEDSGKLNVHSQGENNIDVEYAKTLLDEEQVWLCEELENNTHNYFITGKAGTGKSFLLNTFRETTRKKHIVLAPTGMAALNVKGATLHSTFGYDNLEKLNIDDLTDNTVNLVSDKRQILKEVSTIIIDEISMVRADVFEKIDRILRIINKNHLPFGGKQMILFGDLFQLPPVVGTKAMMDYLQDRFNGIYFFCSNAYKNGSFKFFELTINHRQKEDDGFFSMLNRIRTGSVTDEDISILNSRIVIDESIYDRFTTLLPTKKDVEDVNKRYMKKLPSTPFTYEAKVVFNKKQDQNHNLEKSFPILSSLCLKKGALVMMVANDPEHRWVNGTLGIVSDLKPEKIMVAIDKQIYSVSPFEFAEQEIIYEDGRIVYEDVYIVEQFPIIPAYAITIHKSQGQTFQNVVCDINKCFANGQAYVALSRCASLKGLHIRGRISGSSITVDESVLAFYNEHSPTVVDKIKEN